MSKQLIIFLLNAIICSFIISCEEDDPIVINLAPEVNEQSFTIDENSVKGTLIGTIHDKPFGNPYLFCSLESGTGTLFADMAKNHKISERVTFYDHLEQDGIKAKMGSGTEGLVVLDGVDRATVKIIDLAKWRAAFLSWSFLASMYGSDKRALAV